MNSLHSLRPTATAALLACCAGIAGCTINASEGDSDDHWDDDPVDLRHSASAAPSPLPSGLVGREVTLHLRRDALGMSGAGPIGLNLDGPVREDSSVTGIYRGRDGDWIRLERPDGGTLYVNSAQVLAAETRGAPAGP